MWNLGTIEAMNNKIISYKHIEVKKCRANCNKTCCINCDNFLSAELGNSPTGKLSNLICAKRDDKIQTWSGANECEHYLIPPRGG
jgi:hypothetical protein